ncbi:MAG: alpha/beta fold hydrolase [Paracoccaceae bacterium]
MQLFRWLAIVGFLTACADTSTLNILPQAAEIGEIEPVFIGTTRDTDPESHTFSGARHAEVRFARIDVSIPPERRSGSIDWPKKGAVPDPATDFVAAGQKLYPDPGSFRADLSRAIAAKGGEAVIFVHGFNNSYVEGAYRVAQLGHDLNVGAALVHYSWPSRDSPLGYVYDRDSALFARDGLEKLIATVEEAGARRIVLVAHSLGGGIAMETLRSLALAGRQDILSRIVGVVLMSPDIDVDVFREEALRIGKLPQPFLIFTSRKDRALALSARLTGQKDRLGNLEDPAVLGDLKVTLVDTTAFSTGLGHFNVGNSAALLKILGNIGDVDTAFAADKSGRPGLLGGAVLTVQNATQIVLSPVSSIATGLQN